MKVEKEIRVFNKKPMKEKLDNPDSISILFFVKKLYIMFSNFSTFIHGILLSLIAEANSVLCVIQIFMDRYFHANYKSAEITEFIASDKLIEIYMK